MKDNKLLISSQKLILFNFLRLVSELQLHDLPLQLVQGALVAQWVKGWPNDQTVPSSRPAGGEIFSALNRVPLHSAFHNHLPIVLMTEILLKRM